MANYKLKEGAKCYPFGAHCKEVVNEVSDAETQILLTDSIAEMLIERGSEEIEILEELKTKTKNK